MTREEFAALREGDIVRGKSSGMSFVVLGNYGNHVIAIREADITNPEEWEIVQKVKNEMFLLLQEIRWLYRYKATADEALSMLAIDESITDSHLQVIQRLALNALNIGAHDNPISVRDDAG